MIDQRFSAHNQHLSNTTQFAETDPHLSKLAEQPYVFESYLIRALPTEPGIYTLGGGRQIGKTTLLKQWMQYLLSTGTEPNNLIFLVGELIDDHHSLVTLLEQEIQTMPNNKKHFIIVDEVTYIDQWVKGIKFLADAGRLSNTVLILTGSDLALIQEARTLLPGRRGNETQVDFHYYPLSFYEYLTLTHKDIDWDSLLKQSELDKTNTDLIFTAFDQYLVHGGYLTAINDIALHQQIRPSTLAIYSDWIRGDFIKRNKQESSLREIISAIIKHYEKQITWNNLTQSLSIDHPKTVIDYCELLASLDAIFIQSAVLTDKLVAAPKKAKKIIFTDPFVYHANAAWIKPTNNPYGDQILPTLQDPQRCSELVEACVATHIRRFHETFYIKGKKEIDVAYVKDEKLWAIEIKWTTQLRPEDLKYISQFPRGELWANSKKTGNVDGLIIKPLPIALAQLY